MAKGENIYKRKDGRWEARYKKGYDKNRKIKYGYCYGHSYKEAKEKLNRAKAEFIFYPDIRSFPFYKDDFYNCCLRWLKRNDCRLKKSTFVKYLSILEKHIKPKLGEYPIDKLNSDLISEFTDELLYKKQLAPKTVRDILAFVHEVLISIQTDSRNQLFSIKITYPKLERKELRILSMEEQQRFIRFLMEDIDIYKFSILLTLFTGLRIGEICGLQWKYISMKTNLLTVKYTVQRIKNLDTSSPQKTILQLGSPKTESSIRTIPFTDQIKELLKKFQPDDQESFLLTGNDQLIDPRKLQRKLKKYTDILGLNDIHFHTLRHTFATRCVEIGCDIKTLSEILGHSNISTTMNLYVHPSIDLKRKNIEKLAQMNIFPPSDQ